MRSGGCLGTTNSAMLCACLGRHHRVPGQGRLQRVLWGKSMETEDILMCPGPNEIADRVIRAMLHPAACPVYEEFQEFYEQTLDMLAQVFQTTNQVVPSQAQAAVASRVPSPASSSAASAL